MPSEVVKAELVPSGTRELAQKSESLDSWLQESERYALDFFLTNFQKGGSSTYPIAPAAAAQLYTLYLNGRTLDEIRKLNHPSFSLGQIVHAAVSGDWYRRKQEYQNNLLNSATVRAQQIGCESLQFLADALAAAHKQHGEALQKYLMSGNPADLGSFGVGSIRQYKEVVEMLLKLIGQDKSSSVKVSGVVQHVAGDSAVAGTPVVAKSLAQLTAEKKEAQLLEDEKRGREK